MRKIRQSKLSGSIASKIRIEFGNLEVVDGDDPIRLMPRQCDIEGAVQKDPTRCVFARCAKRMYGATKVIFWKTSCYVDMPGTDGVRRVERRKVSDRNREALELFDRGGEFKEGDAFTFYPYTGRRTMKRMKMDSRAYRNSKLGKAAIKASNATDIRKRAEARLKLVTEKLATARASEKRGSKVLHSAVKQVAAVRKTLKNAVIRESEAVAKHTRVRGVNGPHKTRTFDLAVRNGAGHYNIVPAA
jgi:hypothetical protein